MIPITRIQILQDVPENTSGRYILYWMTSNRRAHYNYALEYAVQQAIQYNVPLIVFEGLRTSYPWSSRRMHQFVIEGMEDQKVHFDKNNIQYLPYVEPHENAGKGLLAALAQEAVLVVTDLFPTFFLTKMQQAFKNQNAEQRIVRVDSNGLMPLQHSQRTFFRAYDYRRFVQKEMERFILERPLKDPSSSKKLNREKVNLQHIFDRWEFPWFDSKKGLQSLLDKIPFQRSVAEGLYRGGAQKAQKKLAHFLKHHLVNYHEKRNDAQEEGTSFLSPYLHFGHISAHDVFWKIMKSEKWDPTQVSTQRKGQREGFWRLSPGVESFLDQLVVWREIGFNTCFHVKSHDTFESLPGWAQQTLLDHSGDEKEYIYTLDQFEKSQTHDDIWNAAQRQLVQEGRMHNYLRMLWGKKILEWTTTPMDALAIMIELNNKYALDGRDPNSYSGIFWVLGRYDRAWGPERPVFGKIRFMSSDSTRRKLKLKTYLETYGPQAKLL